MKMIFFVLLLIQAVGQARTRDVSLNQDVFVCRDSVRALALAEYQAVNQKQIGLPSKATSLQEMIAWLKQDLNVFTPSRARLLEQIFTDAQRRISYQKNIQVQRVSPPSQLIVPEGCQVEPVLVFSLSMETVEKPFSAMINDDLFERLSPEDQVVILWTLALDVEQVIFSLNRMRNDVFADFEFDQLRSRQFIQCWLDADCKPRSMSDFHQMAKNLKLDYFEQSGILIPRKSAVFGFQGLIQQSHRMVSLLTSDDFEGVFDSHVIFPEKVYTISSVARGGTADFVSYTEDGRLQCASLFGVRQDFGPFSGEWHTALPSSAYPFSFPMCWDQEFHLLQGYLPISWKTDFRFDLNGNTMKISRDPLSGGTDQGTIIILDKYRNLKWLNHVSGTQSLGVNGNLKINGYIKMRPDQSIECAQLAQDANLKDNKGSVFKFRVRNKTADTLLCFNSKGEYETSYSLYTFPQFFLKDLGSIE